MPTGITLYDGDAQTLIQIATSDTSQTSGGWSNRKYTQDTKALIFLIKQKVILLLWSIRKWQKYRAIKRVDNIKFFNKAVSDSETSILFSTGTLSNTSVYAYNDINPYSHPIEGILNLSNQKTTFVAVYNII